jgi:hypothetical protein
VDVESILCTRNINKHGIDAVVRSAGHEADEGAFQHECGMVQEKSSARVEKSWDE